MEFTNSSLPQALNLSANSIALRPAEFYSTHDIEVQLGREMTSLDLAGKKVTYSDGESQTYDSLLLATGSK